MTGSSAAHIIKLRSSKLGGGRARLFRLPPLLFIEYLYFTGRISSYEDYENVRPEDFEDYLFLEGLDNQLKITFDGAYFDTFYDEVRLSNERKSLTTSKVKLDHNDLYNLANLLAYKLSEPVGYIETVLPKVGEQEHVHARNLGIRVKKHRIDLSTTILGDSKAAVPDMTIVSIRNVLDFLLHSGLANIEFTHISETAELRDMGQILTTLRSSATTADFVNLFDEISICMTSPLFYTRIGADILKSKGVDSEILKKGMLFGKMLELYVRGGLARTTTATILTSDKLKYFEGGEEIGEVDIFDARRYVLCELGTDNKKDKDLNLMKYYKDTPFIRVGSSRTKNYFTGQFYRIPYAKLCCMVDTGDIFKLEKTLPKNVDFTADDHFDNNICDSSHFRDGEAET